MKLAVLLALIRTAVLLLAVASAFDVALLLAVGPRSYAVFPLLLLVLCAVFLRTSREAIRRAVRPSRPLEPQDVRIEHADGTVTPMALILDPEVYRDGITRWIAMAPEGTVIDPHGGDKLSAGLVPPRTSIVFSARVRMLPGTGGDADACGR